MFFPYTFTISYYSALSFAIISDDLSFFKTIFMFTVSRISNGILFVNKSRFTDYFKLASKKSLFMIILSWQKQGIYIHTYLTLIQEEVK